MKHASKNSPRKQGSRHLLYIVLGFALGLAGLSGLVYDVMPGRANLGSPEIGGSFAMLAQDGRVVTDADLAGRPYLVFFGYTHCPDVCPTALIDISAVFKELGPGKKVAALFITVDLERDTPKVMQQYIESFDPRIVGLTGTPQQIAAAAHEYGAYYVRHSIGPGPNDYVVDHSTYLYVMDPRGRFVRAFDPNASGDQIADVLHTLVARLRESTGINRSATRRIRGPVSAIDP